MKSLKLSASACMLLFAALGAGCGEPGNTAISKSTNANDTSQSGRDKQNISTFKSGYSPVNGIKMYYEIHGEGNPLVLIHGGGSTIQTTFGRILPFLAKSRQVIAVELQAHGHTEDRDAPESFEQDADDVAALLKNLDISKADFMGFSNGGNTTMQIAIRHPEIVSKVIIASAFYKRAGMIPGLFDGLKKATMDSMPQALKAAYLQEIPDKDRLRIMFEKDRNRMVNFKDWNDKDIQSIKAPALLINGDMDVVLTEHAVAMSRLIPHCKLAIIPGGHGTYLGEITTLTDGMWKEKYVVPLIEQFLNSPAR